MRVDDQEAVHPPRLAAAYAENLCGPQIAEDAPRSPKGW
jgi:hypothetical protein